MPSPFELEDQEFLEEVDADVQEHLPEGDEPDEGSSRKDRRNARVEDYQSKLSELEANYNRLQGRLEEVTRGAQQPPPQQISPEELTQRVQQHFQPILDKAMEDREAAGTTVIALQERKAPQAEVDAALKRYRESEVDFQDKVAQRRNALNIAGQPRPDPAAQRQGELRAQLQQSYPDVFQHPHASTEFYAQLLRKSKGAQGYRPSQDDIQEAVELARKEAGLSGLSPTEHQRRATSGMPAGHAGQPSGGGQRPLTTMDRRIAEQLYDSESDPKKREARYRKEVLSQMQS